MCREIQLPNITGEISGEMGAFPKGAFRLSDKHWNCGSAVAGSSDPVYTFNASRYNNIYSGSNFQPSAGLSLLCIKT